MTRSIDAEKEAIRLSADAARSLLVSLRQQKEKLDDRISKLQAVVDAWEAISGKKKEDASAEPGAVTVIGRVRAKKGEVPRHIDLVLQEGAEYEEPELRKAIKEKFGVTYGRATVYTCLRRGLKDHKYVQNGKKWSVNPLKTLQRA